MIVRDKKTKALLLAGDVPIAEVMWTETNDAVVSWYSSAAEPRGKLRCIEIVDPSLLEFRITQSGLTVQQPAR